MMSSLPLDRSLSQRITALRYPLIILVVFIHNVPTSARINGVVTELTIPADVDLIRTLFSQILCRIAVPLLFMISGFLLFRKETSFFSVLKKKSRTLLVPYLLWTLLSVALYLGAHAVSTQWFQSVSFQNYTWIDWVDVFAGLFTNRAPYPLVYQLWFVRDLFVLSLLFLPLKALIDRAPFPVLAALVLLWLSHLPPVVVSYEALLFFSMGYYVVKYDLRIETLDSVAWPGLTLVYGAGVTLELLYPSGFPALHQINILFGCVAALKLTRGAPARPGIFRVLETGAGLAFFVYALHEPVLGVLRILWFHWFPAEGQWLLVAYFGVVVVDVVLVTIVGWLLKKLLPPVYHALTGER